MGLISTPEIASAFKAYQAELKKIQDANKILNSADAAEAA